MRATAHRLPAASVLCALAATLGAALGAGDAAAAAATRQPCRLVTRAEAARILGAVRAPVTAPQGPTCIYRSVSGRRFVTLAVQRRSFRKLTAHLRHKRRVRVRGASGTAYCVTAGSPTLYVPVSGGRVLTVGGPCAVGRRFALRALPRLKG